MQWGGKERRWKGSGAARKGGYKGGGAAREGRQGRAHLAPPEPVGQPPACFVVNSVLCVVHSVLCVVHSVLCVPFPRGGGVSVGADWNGSCGGSDELHPDPERRQAEGG